MLVGLIALGALLGCGGRVSEQVRRHTYPPSFRYFTHSELESTMWKLASLVSQLDDTMRDDTAADPSRRREEVDRLLAEMIEASRALGPGGWPSNHPLVSRNVERFRLDLRAARRAVQMEPPSYYLAGSISGACLHCHAGE